METPKEKVAADDLELVLSSEPVAAFSIPTLSTSGGFTDARRSEEFARSRGSKKRFTVEQMWSTHKEIARLAALGLDHKEIATAVGVSQACVSYTLNSPLVQHQVNILQADRDSDTVDVLEQIKALAPKAVALMDQVMESVAEPTSLRMRAAQSVLEFVVPKRTQVEGIHAVLSLQDIEAIKVRAREMRLREVEAQNAQVV